MNKTYRILVLEDEPLILMDLELAGEDRGCTVLSSTSCHEALGHLNNEGSVHAAILDVTLAEGCTSIPVAEELNARGIPFLLHSGDLDRHEERVRTLHAPLMAKPAAAEKVIAAAIAMYEGRHSEGPRLAAE